MTSGTLGVQELDQLVDFRRPMVVRRENLGRRIDVHPCPV